MPDLLVKLYDLPAAPVDLDPGVTVRPAMAYERHEVVGWIGRAFGRAWASEAEVAFSAHPISCLIATRDGRIVGFACYDSTCRGFFGPTGVDEDCRGQGIGKALLFAALHAMRQAGYAYAIIGGAGPVEYYERTVAAVEIPGSVPGVYRDRLTED